MWYYQHLLIDVSMQIKTNEIWREDTHIGTVKWNRSLQYDIANINIILLINKVYSSWNPKVQCRIDKGSPLTSD